jgi:hypothetical protein
LENGEASTLLRQRLEVRDENLDGLFVGGDLDTDGLVAKGGDDHEGCAPEAVRNTLPTDPQFELV